MPGLRDARWPGRLEVIRPALLTVIYVAYTPDAIRQALASLHAIHGAVGWIWRWHFLRQRRRARSWTHGRWRLTRSSAPWCITREWPPKRSPARARGQSRVSVQVAATIEAAAEFSRTLAVAQHRKIDVAGGSFLVIDPANLAEAAARRT